MIRALSDPLLSSHCVEALPPFSLPLSSSALYFSSLSERKAKDREKRYYTRQKKMRIRVVLNREGGGGGEIEGKECKKGARISPFPLYWPTVRTCTYVLYLRAGSISAMGS